MDAWNNFLKSRISFLIPLYIPLAPFSFTEADLCDCDLPNFSLRILSYALFSSSRALAMSCSVYRPPPTDRILGGSGGGSSPIVASVSLGSCYNVCGWSYWSKFPLMMKKNYSILVDKIFKTWQNPSWLRISWEAIKILDFQKESIIPVIKCWNMLITVPQVCKWYLCTQALPPYKKKNICPVSQVYGRSEKKKKKKKE